ncbi:MAG TPA: hypothetical protein VGO50_01805 [Pyrinomonadaceae bacterium]|jgi:hypothetical protein|nr:hypothetical protein [Pyrinomonadaceae bacterium]
MEENGTAPAAEAVTAPKAEETAAEATAAATTETPAAEAPAEAPIEAPIEAPVEAAAEPEEISYHAVEKEGHVTAIWEMQGRKHLRTIDPRSSEGKQIMELYTAETHE